jgi:hypothetical protein
VAKIYIRGYVTNNGTKCLYGNVYPSSHHTMRNLGLLVTLEAKPGKEAEVEAFLKSALPLAKTSQIH